MAALAAPRSLAQEEDMIDSDLVEQELLNSEDDAPPAAEYPYPGAKEEGVVAAAPPPPTQRPIKVNDETGDYYYGTDDTSAAKQYEVSDKPATFSGREGVEKPATTKANGEFNYVTEASPRNAAFSFRVGMFQPPEIINGSTEPSATDFATIYTKDQLPVIFGDYEKILTTKVGRLGLKFGSGIFLAQGKGVFKTVDPGRRQDDMPEEQYTFFMLPNQLTAVYRFQYSDTQPIVPFVEGGGGFFTFMEIRDDDSSPRFGGAGVLAGAGGLNFLMDWIDPKAIRRLDNEYGINHVWLTTEFRYVKGLNKKYDFTSAVANVGVMMEF
ncbi:MAG: hypothetical protein EOP05_05110 [Proteobacteria bacterium]|nr:MAG: hypothetical protein EOP05_05110 [Pseudomonadota bacterium]